MALTRREKEEWEKVKKKAKEYKIPVKRAYSNVLFSGGVYAILGTGNALRIINAKIRLKKKRS